MNSFVKPTKTTNRIHFSDFKPARFEEICFMLLLALHKWKKLEHIGRSGSDGGVDIKGVLSSPSGDKIWMVQCKCLTKAFASELKLMVDKILSNYPMPDKILLIVSCDLSKKSRDYIETYCKELGVPELEIWTSTNLEAHLYANPKVRSLAFGISEEPETKANIQKINRGLKMKTKLLKALIDEKFIKDPNNRQALLNDPSLKFICDEVYIRSVNDTTYGTGLQTPKGTFNTSYRTYFYNIYHSGLEFWLSAGIGTDIIMDKDGLWEPVYSSGDKRLKNPKYRVFRAKEIGRIPYHRIMDFTTDGDEYTSCPHLFCLFDGDDGMPYEEIYYRYESDRKGNIFDWDFDKQKQTVFQLEE